MARRRVLGPVIGIARALGWMLVLLAILGLHPLRVIDDPIAGSLSLLGSAALLLGGILWLVAVEAFVRFFDQYLSRN